METQTLNVSQNPALQQGAISGCSIQFKRKYSMQNGNKVTKKNWQKIIAISNKPCTNVLGFPAIEEAKINNQSYYEKWKLVYEKAEDKKDNSGYIFREVNHNGGINGRHKTFKQAIWWALNHSHISVWLEEEMLIADCRNTIT